MVTHVPMEPSKFGTDADETDEQLQRYNYMPRNNKAIPSVLSTADQPALKDALASTDAHFSAAAIQEEFDTITNANTHEEVSHSPRKALSSGVSLTVKRDQEGQPARLKARLLARGNLQAVDEGDYESHYAPVACFDLVRILLSLSTALD